MRQNPTEVLPLVFVPSSKSRIRCLHLPPSALTTAAAVTMAAPAAMTAFAMATPTTPAAARKEKGGVKSERGKCNNHPGDHDPGV